MAITKMTKDVKNIQALGDRPNAIDGLTSQELKRKFDQAGEDLKSYINNSLTEELDIELGKSKKCDNTFDNGLLARQNLKIKYGTSLPTSGSEGDLFFLYTE